MMQPERKKVVDGQKIEEFYWNGKMIVYVDNRLSDKAYDDITAPESEGEDA